MTDEASTPEELLVFESARFGKLSVPKESMIEFPSGLIGFPTQSNFVLIEHKPPFSWLHSIEQSSLAFVVIDGFDFGPSYDLSLPFSHAECDFQESDEYAILLIVTVRGDPKSTTANLKAPLFVNIRNKTGVQVIYDDPSLSTRAPLWKKTEGEKEGDAAKQESRTAEPKAEK